MAPALPHRHRAAITIATAHSPPIFIEMKISSPHLQLLQRSKALLSRRYDPKVDDVGYMVILTQNAMQRAAEGKPAIPLNPKNKKQVCWQQIAIETGISYSLLNSQASLREHVMRLLTKYGAADPTVVRLRQAALNIVDTYRDVPPPTSNGNLHASEISRRCGITLDDLRSEICQKALALCASMHDVANPVEETNEIERLATFCSDPEIRRLGVPWHAHHNTPHYAKIAKVTNLRPDQLRREPFAPLLKALVDEVGPEPFETTEQEIARFEQFVDDAITANRPVPTINGRTSIGRIAKEVGIKIHRFAYVPALAAALARWEAANPERGSL